MSSSRKVTKPNPRERLVRRSRRTTESTTGPYCSKKRRKDSSVTLECFLCSRGRITENCQRILSCIESKIILLILSPNEQVKKQDNSSSNSQQKLQNHQQQTKCIHKTPTFIGQSTHKQFSIIMLIRRNPPYDIIPVRSAVIVRHNSSSSSAIVVVAFVHDIVIPRVVLTASNTGSSSSDGSTACSFAQWTIGIWSMLLFNSSG